MVNANIKNTIYLAVAVLVLIPGIYHLADYIHFHRHMLDLKVDDETCDSNCATNVTARTHSFYREGYACVEIDADRFVCRPPRGYGNFKIQGDPFMQAAAPVSYGEIYMVPADGNHMSAYHIRAVRLADELSDRIRVDFASNPGGTGAIVHTATMVPGDTYVECNPYSQNVFHLVEYTGTFDLNGTRMAEFWAAHIWPQPPELSPCDAKKTISRSLQIDYDLGLPSYEEFERAFLENQSWEDNLAP